MGSYISSLSLPEEIAGFPRSLVILGSTGSIGTSALKVIQEHASQYEIVGLAGARNAKLLAEQAATWRPAYLGVLTDDVARELKTLLPKDYAPEILVGPEGYAYMAALPKARMALCAQVGAAGLKPTLSAVEAGKIVALANKEALVLAGDLIREAARASGAVILPVDSEHNALFQGLSGHESQDVRKLILTASGGPFRGKDRQFLEAVTPQQALKHPNWSMGAKISIDSATLMNKGLEVIEAWQLYGLGLEHIEVVVHPQSIIHSLVEYHDGSLLAHLGQPDMCIPISYCLGYPKRFPLQLERLDLVKVGSLTFEAPDLSLFPCLRLAMDAIKGPAGSTVVLNAANEIVVDEFLKGKVPFVRMPELIENAMQSYAAEPIPTGESGILALEQIVALDNTTRELVSGWVQNAQ